MYNYTLRCRIVRRLQSNQISKVQYALTVVVRKGLKSNKLQLNFAPKV